MSNFHQLQFYNVGGTVYLYYEDRVNGKDVSLQITEAGTFRILRDDENDVTVTQPVDLRKTLIELIKKLDERESSNG